MSSTEVALLDDEGKAAGFGDSGELCIKGPQVMRGYWQNSSETQKVFTKDGWLRTGDIARMDGNGFFYIVDRKKDMIIVSGFKIFPTEIENVIAAHPAVLEVAVIGIPCAEAGEQVIAIIVKKNPQLTDKDIINYCREQLTCYKIPKQVIFKSSLPKSTVGKILRRVLREEMVGKPISN